MSSSSVPAQYAEKSKLLSEYRLDPNEPVLSDPSGQQNRQAWKKVALAVCLLCLGTLLLTLGLGFWFTGKPNGKHVKLSYY